MIEANGAKVRYEPKGHATDQDLGGVWFVFSNNNFQFLNNISRILTYFFTYTYFQKYF